MLLSEAVNGLCKAYAAAFAGFTLPVTSVLLVFLAVPVGPEAPPLRGFVAAEFSSPLDFGCLLSFFLGMTVEVLCLMMSGTFIIDFAVILYGPSSGGSVCQI